MKRVPIVLIAFMICVGAIVSFSPSAHAAPAITAAGPTAPAWYFAEGRVGAGFVQWLTVGNPNDSDCSVTIKYDYVMDGTTAPLTKSVTFVVDRLTRHTQYVNNDLSVKQFDTNAATLSAVVSTGDCAGITAERPMYFSDFHNVSSGTDVMGATAPQNTWYFAEVPAGSSGESFLPVFNPNNADANVKVSYYVGGATPVSETKTVVANSRNTFFPNDLAQLTTHQHVAVKVESLNGVPIVVERPTYFKDVHGVSGAADIMGVTSLAPQWILAAGTVASGNHEDLIIANPSTATNIAVTIELMSATANVNITQVLGLIPANGQIVYDINANNTFTGHTDDVSVIVTGWSGTKTPANILVQREIFSQYTGSNVSSPGWSENGVSDSHGVPNINGTPNIEAPHASTFNLPTAYSFAEGFTSVDFNEWMMLANPTSNDETISIELINMLGEKDTHSVPVPAHSRYSFNVTSMVENSHTFTLSNVKAYAVSSIVTGDGPFAVERVMYWKAFDTHGTSAVPGFSLPVVLEAVK